MNTFEIFRDNKKRDFSENDISEHYMKLSVRCAVLKWLSLTILAVFVIFSVKNHGDELSFDSIRYIVKYMKDEPSSLISSGDSISYDYDSKNEIYLIGDDFAVVGSDGIRIFEFSGKVLFSDDFNYKSPVAVPFGNQLIVYDIGGKEVRFYNSFSETYRLTLESTVYNVSVSDKETFMVQTSSEGYRSGFQIYTKNFQPFFKTNYGELTLQSSSLSPDGKYAVSACFSTTGNIVSYLKVYCTDIDTIFAECEITGEYPVGVEFIDNENFLVFTDKGVRKYNVSLENSFSHYYWNDSPRQYKINNGKIIITYGTSLLNESTRIEIIDLNGEKSAFEIPCTARDILIDGDFIHVLCNGEINTYNSDFELIHSYSISKNFSHMVKIEYGKYLLSSSDSVEMYIFDNESVVN